ATGACDDGNPCTTGDSCVGGACSGLPVACSDGDICNGVETCNPVDGTCLPGVSVPCDDGNPCTDDFCDPVLGCLHANNTSPCDDGSACTTGDVCASGVCAGVPVVCDDADPCNGVETCDPGTGLCQPGVPLVCDDGNVCTTDTCDPGIGCVFTVGPGGSLCLVGNLTTRVARAPASALGGRSRQ